MERQKFYLYFVICLLLFTEIPLVAAQGNSLTFSPSTPLCVGDTVQMICYVVPPTTQQFDSAAAEIAFNGSMPVDVNDINTNVLSTADTSRYTADVSGLTVSSSRPGIRLIISPYEASDGATNFSCNGVYVGGIPSYSLISGYPQDLAEPVFLSNTNAQVTFQFLMDSRISVNAILLSQFERNDTLFYTYTLEYDTFSESSTPTQDNNYTFMTDFTCDVCYRVSYSAENCAGGSGTISSRNFGLQSVSDATGYFKQSPSDPKHIEWEYRELPCGNIEENFLQEQYFNFSVINRITGVSSNVANSSLNLPYGFSIDIPQNIDIATNAYDLNITFIDPCFNVIIPINIIATSEDNTLTIILGVFFGVLLILLCVLVTITVAFLVIWCMKRTPDKK